MTHETRSGALPGAGGRGALILGNPTCLARHGLDLADLSSLLAAHGFVTEAMALPDVLDGEAWRSRLAASQHAMVIAAGGDGTVNQVINLIAPLGLPLGVLPLGTANDFARGLNLPSDLEDAVRVIAEEPALAVDLATVNGHYFVNAAHLGWGVEAAKRTNATLKEMVGPLAYLLGAAQAYFEAEAWSVEVCVGDTCMRMQASQLLVGNGRYFGGGNVVAREASLDDGLLDVYVLGAEIGPAEAVKLAASLRTGTLEDQTGVFHARAARLTAKLARPVEVNVDGEILTLDPELSFQVHPRALSVYARSTAAIPLTASPWMTAELF